MRCDYDAEGGGEVKVILMRSGDYAYESIVRRYFWSSKRERFALLPDGWYRTFPTLRQATLGERDALMEFRRERTARKIQTEYEARASTARQKKAGEIRKFLHEHGVDASSAVGDIGA
jgi:hypothetical protein